MDTRVLIGIPALDTLKIDTVQSIIANTATIQAPATLHVHKTSLVHDSRNKIAQTAIDQGYSHLMFVDSDIAFPRDGIQKLLDHNLDIVGGLYYRKKPPHEPTIGVMKGKRLKIPYKFPKTRLFEVYGTGTGFMLIKTEVFKKLTPPYFYFGNLHGAAMGEDMYFCHKAQQKGFKVWVDPTIPLRHIGDYEYDEKDYEAYREGRPAEDVDALWEQENPFDLKIGDNEA